MRRALEVGGSLGSRPLKPCPHRSHVPTARVFSTVMAVSVLLLLLLLLLSLLRQRCAPWGA